MSTRLILDIATCPLAGVEDFLPPVRAKANLKDPVKIAEDLAEKTAAQKDGVSLDIDLCRISAIGYQDVSGWAPSDPMVFLMKTEAEERQSLTDLRGMLQTAETITFNGLAFDLPLIERRLLYLGLNPLRWNLDKYRTNHVDLMAKLSNFGARPYRPLQFYIKRLGWTDLSKTLSGAEEALAPGKGQWDELEASVRHDLSATYRLAQWMRVLPESGVDGQLTLGDGLVITEGSIL